MKKIIVFVSFVLLIFGCTVESKDVFSKEKVSIYLMGDSIVASKNNENAVNGWGNQLYKYIGGTKVKIKIIKPLTKYESVIRYTTSNVTIENWAKSGSSVKSFKDSGLFGGLYKKLKKGNYVFIQLGHNETNAYCKGSDVNTYKKYLNYYITQIKKKKAVPVLITPPPVCEFKNGKCKIYVSQYRKAMMSVAAKRKVQCIDLSKKTCNYFTKIGQKKTRTFYIDDKMHFTRDGAKTLARIIASDINNKNQPKAVAKNVTLNTRNIYKTLKKVTKLKSKKYTTSSWNRFQGRYSAAQKTMYNISSNQKAINKADKKLKYAIKKLKRRK